MNRKKREEILEEARRLIAEGRQKDALACLDPYIREFTQDVDARILAGVAHAQLGQMFAAERHLREAYIIYEGNYEVGMMLMRVLMNQYKWEEALPVAERLRKDFPNDRVVKVSLESIRENVVRPAVGWERDENKPRVDIEFGGER